MKTKMKILGVCGAQGALLFPLRKHEIVANVEPRGVFHSKNEEQWRLNFGDVPFLKKLDQLKSVKRGEIDVIVGSPSCGHSSAFSYSRKKTLGDPKSDPSVNMFIESIKRFSPKVFLMENLPKLLELIPLENWFLEFEDYEIITLCHSMKYLGNSQETRKRMIMVGVHRDSGLQPYYFSRIFSVNEPKKFKDLYKSIRKELNYRELGDVKLAMYDYRDKEKKTLTVDRIKYLWRHDFKEYYKWPMIGTKMKTLPGVYRNRKNSFPMTARPSSRQFNHKGLPMGLEEYRVIMGFPEKFKVYFDESDRVYWLNKGRNTLTKGAVYEVGLWFKKCLLSSLRGSTMPPSSLF